MIHYGVSVHGWPSGHAQDSEEAIAFAQHQDVKCLTETYKLDDVQKVCTLSSLSPLASRHSTLCRMGSFPFRTACSDLIAVVLGHHCLRVASSEADAPFRRCNLVPLEAPHDVKDRSEHCTMAGPID